VKSLKLQEKICMFNIITKRIFLIILTIISVSALTFVIIWQIDLFTSFILILFSIKAIDCVKKQWK